MSALDDIESGLGDLKTAVLALDAMSDAMEGDPMRLVLLFLASSLDRIHGDLTEAHMAAREEARGRSAGPKAVS